MFKSIINFIKYNNAALLILAIIFLISTGVLATETGRAALGQRQTSVEGVDNTLLLEAEIDNLDMDFKIEKIEADDLYYYVTYTFIDLIKSNQVWQYQMQEKVRKISRKLKQDLGLYLAEELGEEYEARIKDLKEEQAMAGEEGESKRLEVTEFSGLIGATLNIASQVFPNYQPVVTIELPSPNLPTTLAAIYKGSEPGNSSSGADNLTIIALEAAEKFASLDSDLDGVVNNLDNCINIYNPDQTDSDSDGVGDVCDTDIDGGTTTSPPTDVTSDDLDMGTSTDETATTTEDQASEPQPEADQPLAGESSSAGEPTVEIIELPIEEPIATST